MRAESLLSTGTRFADVYEIVATRALGARGTTYAARRIDTGAPVALSWHHAMIDTGQRRRLDEVRARLAGVTHVGLAVPTDMGVVSERMWITTELVSGTSLEDELLRGAIPMRRAATIAAQVARALAVAHEAGLYHRSLKPANVMLADGRGAIVLDLGVSAILCSDGQTIATPNLGSPEEWGGGKVDARSDIYSLGGLLFQMLVGKPPFSGSLAELCDAHARKPPPRLRAVKPSAQPLEAIVTRMLEKRPDDRFQTMFEVVQALEEVLAAPEAPLNVDASDPAPELPLTIDGQSPKTWQLTDAADSKTVTPTEDQPRTLTPSSPQAPSQPAQPTSRRRERRRRQVLGALLLVASTLLAFVAGLYWARR